MGDNYFYYRLSRWSSTNINDTRKRVKVNTCTLSRQINYNKMDADRQSNHCVYKMPPQTTLQFSSTRAEIIDRVFWQYFTILISTVLRINIRPDLYYYRRYGCSSKTVISVDQLYTVNHKKCDTLFLTITLAKLNRFL